MKLDCHKLSRWLNSRYSRSFHYNRWFAWYPVTCDDTELCHWFEYVWRIRFGGGRGDDYWVHFKETPNNAYIRD